jgi:hypothetical protein
MKITKEQLKAILVEEVAKALDEEHAGMHDMHSPMAKVARLYHSWKPTTPEGEQYHRELGDALGLMQEEKDDDFMQDAAEDTKEKGHEGIFKKWCKDPEQGFEGVNQSCVDKAYEVGAPWKKRAALAVTYSRAEGGAPSLEYPEDKEG